MFILIDCERACVLYKHKEQTVLYDLTHIELSHHATKIILIKDYEFAITSFSKNKSLYESLCGQLYVGTNASELHAKLAGMCDIIPESVLDVKKLALQAAKIPLTSSEYFKYNPYGVEPMKLDVQHVGKALLSNANAAPLVSGLNTKQSAPAAHTQAAVPVTTIPKANKPASVSERPKDGTLTGKVWQIADEVYLSNPNVPIKQLRSLIIDACKTEIGRAHV